MTKDEALKLALEALENLFGIPDKWTGEGGGDVAVWRLGGSYRAQQAITAIKEALAQPEQEPVATLDALEQEIYENTRQFVSRDVMEWMLKRYYTSPPQRTWVGLTDEEANELWESTDTGDDWELMKRTEAKLKEKNT